MTGNTKISASVGMVSQRQMQERIPLPPRKQRPVSVLSSLSCNHPQHRNRSVLGSPTKQEPRSLIDAHPGFLFLGDERRTGSDDFLLCLSRLNKPPYVDVLFPAQPCQGDPLPLSNGRASPHCSTTSLATGSFLFVALALRVLSPASLSCSLFRSLFLTYSRSLPNH